MNKPKTRNENIVIQEMNAELLIYDLKDNKAFCLNETSAIIYQLCDGKRTIAEINKAVAKQLNQPVNDELIWLALDGLKKEGLLENNEIEIDFNGLNRRQIIRKVGLASMIILPMVSSIIAPQAANAASGQVVNLALCAGCSSPSQCTSGFCLNGRCSPPGNVAGFPPTSVTGGNCPSSPFACSNLCTRLCCSGLTNLSGSCLCSPVP